MPLLVSLALHLGYPCGASSLHHQKPLCSTFPSRAHNAFNSYICCLRHPEEEARFMKDSWRIVAADVQVEGQVDQLLDRRKVRNAPLPGVLHRDISPGNILITDDLAFEFTYRLGPM